MAPSLFLANLSHLPPPNAPSPDHSSAMLPKRHLIVWVLPLVALVLLVVSSSFSTTGDLALAAPIHPATDSIANGPNLVARGVVKDKKIEDTMVKHVMRGVEEVSPTARRANSSRSRN